MYLQWESPTCNGKELSELKDWMKPEWEEHSGQAEEWSKINQGGPDHMCL